MNETTTTTLFEGAKDKQMFAEVIIDIIKGQHKEEYSVGRHILWDKIPTAYRPFRERYP